jgi:hypothetical protein
VITPSADVEMRSARRNTDEWIVTVRCLERRLSLDRTRRGANSRERVFRRVADC